MNWEEFNAARQLIADEKFGPGFAAVEDEEDRALAKARRFASDK